MSAVAVTPDAARIYAPNSGLSNGGGGDVSVIDTATNTVVHTIPVRPNPTGVAATPDGARVYVSNSGFLLPGGDSVSVVDTSTDTVDTSTDTVVATVPVGHHPFAYGRFISEHRRH